MKRMLAFALIVTVLSACNGQPSGPKTEGPDGTGTPAVPGTTKDNIGDLEQAVIVEAEVAQQSESPNIDSTPLIDPTQRMNLLTIDVSPPLPDELWLNVKVRSKREFGRNPGVLRVAIKDGEQVLDTFGMVIGESVAESKYEHAVNVLAARDSVPETMLITIDVEALLMPEGTDPASIDPMTAEVPESRYSQAVATPPIRINFEGAGSAPSEPAVETPEEGAAPQEAAPNSPESAGNDANS